MILSKKFATFFVGVCFLYFQTASSLKCYKCSTSLNIPRATCLHPDNKTNIEVCKPDQACAISEQSISDGHRWKKRILQLSRGCSSQSSGGCWDQYHRLLCTHVCRTDFCNVGNSSSIMQPSVFSLFVLFILMPFLWAEYLVDQH